MHMTKGPNAADPHTHIQCKQNIKMDLQKSFHGFSKIWND